MLDSNVDLETISSVNTHLSSNVRETIVDRFDRISSWPKLLRVTAYCKRFINRFVNKYSKGTEFKNEKESNFLSSMEIEGSRLFWIKLLQKEFFSKEINQLNQGLKLLNSPIKNLVPFIDKMGILRLVGRLQNAPISFNEKDPFILPNHRISRLIISHTHSRTLHGGTQLTLHTLRQNYWVLNGRSIVKSIIRECVTCVKQRAVTSQQLMGSLPDFKVTPSRPFMHTGIDYAGPYDLLVGFGRGSKTRKAWIALFVCCVTRAIHLELVSDYSSEEFRSAYERFTSRRGVPAHLYSDNAKNFVGASNELENYLLELGQNVELCNDLITRGTEWNFIPPSAPHFGGLWEAGVKSVKHHLRRVVGLLKFNFEEFYTILTRIEAALNSRPISPLSDDSEDFSYLTPGHFLVGSSINSVHEPSLEFIPENRLSRWQRVQRVTQLFWRKWTIDYVQVLQKRYKWFDRLPNLELGDVVLIRQDNLPPTKWKLGRIIKCYLGKDDLVRGVRVRTADSEFDRPIAKLCLLPVRCSKSDELRENEKL